MKRPMEAVLLCEGFDDRSFWKGWIERLHQQRRLVKEVGWKEARSVGLHSKRAKKSAAHGDATSEENVPGCYSYETPAGGLVHVIPSQGRKLGEGGLPDDVREFARIKLLQRIRKPLARLVLNVDVDDGSVDALRRSIESLAGASAQEIEGGDLRLEDGTLLSLIPWYVSTPETGDPPGAPAKQTLERLVCMAICRAKPEWGQDVHDWLAGRRDKRGAEHKAHGWSYVAGWFADHGPGDYYAAVWRDEAIASELEKLMVAIGARRVVDALAALGTTDD